MWTKAFWKDAGERVLGTVLAAMVVLIPVDLTGLKELSLGETLAGLGLLGFATLVKCLLAVLKNPNTGASFGTTVPGDIVEAYTTQKTITEDGDKIGMGYPDTVLAHPGDTVAGKASIQPTDEPVVVSLPGSAT